MLNQHQIQFLPERICKHLSDINTEYLVSVGEVLKEIGELRPTDVHQLQQMYNYGARADEIAKRLAVVSQKDIAEIYDIFDIVAKENYKFAKPFYEARFMDYIPYEENIPLQRKVKAMAKQTVDEYKNMTQHTAFAIFSKDGKSLAPLYEKNANKIATSLSDTYTKIVDYAVTQVNMGMESYTKAVNDIIKAMSASGIRTVDYATGYSRRLDSAVRQNVLWCVKECNQQVANLVGEEFGADGMEVDYHMHPRPSHADIGGRQFALNEVGVVIDGVFYPSFYKVAKPLLEEYGCLHFAFPIILGVSRPAYTEEELAEYAIADKATFEFEGKKYTMYDGTQLQRKVETALRHQRDILNMAKVAGASETELIARGKIRMLTDKYVELSEVSGLPTQMERVKSAVKSVDKSRGSGIINTKVLNRQVVNPMSKERYKTMCTALEKKGIKVLSATSGDDLRYMLAFGAEATYSQGQIMHIGEIPSASAFFEEIIHMVQEKKYGVMLTDDYIERDAREIAANRKLLKYANQYGFDNDDCDDISKNLKKWETSFKERVGVSYEESGYNREI